MSASSTKEISIVTAVGVESMSKRRPAHTIVEARERRIVKNFQRVRLVQRAILRPSMLFMILNYERLDMWCTVWIVQFGSIVKETTRRG